MTTIRHAGDDGNQDDEVVADSYDPFDVSRLRSATFDTIGVEYAMLTVPVRRPNRREFFRVHPDPAFVVDWYVLERDDLERETFWVTDRFHAQLLEELRAVRIFTCMSKSGVVFLWPAKLPTDNSSSRRWSESGLRIAEEAKTLWVRMVGNRDLGAYELYKAQGNLPDPVWPDKSFSDLLRIAFDNGRLIDSPDHPALRELRGEF
jgi:hypothetical protein